MGSGGGRRHFRREPFLIFEDVSVRLHVPAFAFEQSRGSAVLLTTLFRRKVYGLSY